jgi:two-component system OmpR family sensor kinase
MGRLFWKFFFFFWAAQVLTSAGVGVAVWLDRLERDPRAELFERGPPPPLHRMADRPHRNTRCH